MAIADGPRPDRRHAQGGVCRIALTEEDKRGRDQLVQWCRDAGLAVRVDAVGNVFARRAGTDPGAPRWRPAAISTPAFRRQVRRQLRRAGRAGGDAHARRPGYRDARSAGTGVLDQRGGHALHAGDDGLGRLCRPVRFVHAQTDRDGVSVGAALEAIGYRGTHPVGEVPGGMFAAYFEAHIEQGPVLEAAGLPIGVVSGALGQQWYDVTVTGMDAHAGPTPLALRHDALLAAARMVDAVNRIAVSEAPHGRGTVGYLQVSPNSRNVIPGRVEFSVDLRNLSHDGPDRMDAAMRAAFAGIAEHARVEVEIRRW